jgi:hypothetical protein
LEVIGFCLIVALVVGAIRAIDRSAGDIARLSATRISSLDTECEMSEAPRPDQIRRVITSYEAELPRWGVCIQMQTGELVQYGRFVTHERAKYERLALERMLFDGVPTPPPASFNAG